MSRDESMKDHMSFSVSQRGWLEQMESALFKSLNNKALKYTHQRRVMVFSKDCQLDG